MVNKPEYVDLVSEATRQHHRRVAPRLVTREAEGGETSRLSRWPPAMFRQWKLHNLMPWKSAFGKLKNWR